MQHDPLFLGAVLDSVIDQIAVVNSDGTIVYVNAAWNWKREQQHHGGTLGGRELS